MQVSKKKSNYQYISQLIKLSNLIRKNKDILNLLTRYVDGMREQLL